MAAANGRPNPLALALFGLMSFGAAAQQQTTPSKISFPPAMSDSSQVGFLNQTLTAAQCNQIGGRIGAQAGYIFVNYRCLVTISQCLNSGNVAAFMCYRQPAGRSSLLWPLCLSKEEISENLNWIAWLTQDDKLHTWSPCNR